MTRMNESQFQMYLQETHIAHLVTIDQKGYPLITPIWYLYKNKEFYIMSMMDSHKIRNLISNPNVALSIANEERPYKYIALQGDAELVEPFDPEWVKAMCIHYEGLDEGMKFAEDCLKSDMVIVKITVRSMVQRSGI